MARQPGVAFVIGAVFACAVVAPGVAAAQAAPPERPRIVVNLTGAPPQGAEAEHLQTLVRAREAFQRRGFAGLAGNLRALRQALDQAPDAYPIMEQRGEDWIVRGSDMGDTLILTTAASAAGQAAGKTTMTVVQSPNVYPDIALLLGAEAVERGEYAEAIAVLDRGLKIQPGNWLLINERLAALLGQSRWADALALADETLASSDLLVSLHAAPFHRRRGSSLIELGRLDEASAAFEASLETEPGSATAKNELDYIRQLRAGQPATATTLVAPGAMGKAEE